MFAFVELTTNQKGAIAEAMVIAEATKLGIVAYRPVSDGGRADLILEAGDRLLRTQVKWARRRGDVIVVNIRTSRHTPAGYVRTTYAAHEIDGVAAWCAETRQCYWIPIGDIAGQGYLHLRLAPARNNQELLYTGPLITRSGL